MQKITFEQYSNDPRYVCCFMYQRPYGLWDAVAFRDNMWDIKASATEYENKVDAWDDLMVVCDSNDWIAVSIDYRVISHRQQTS